MGGDYYDRDVVSTSSSSGYSAEASKVIGKVNSLHFSLNPQKFKEKNLISENRNPIVFALDVTGSMGDWSKVISFLI
jgi:Mg-chelatase subunit ChlD